MPRKTQADIARQMMAEGLLVRARDLYRHGVAPQTLAKMAARGEAVASSRGVWRLCDADPPIYADIAFITARSPGAIAALLTALDYHGLTMEVPSIQQMGIDPRSRRPHIDWPAVEWFGFNERARTEGVMTRVIKGVTVRVTDPERTVIDCFKWRGNIGKTFAEEALVNLLQRDTASSDRLFQYAASRGVTKIFADAWGIACKAPAREDDLPSDPTRNLDPFHKEESYDCLQLQ